MRAARPPLRHLVSCPGRVSSTAQGPSPIPPNTTAPGLPNSPHAASPARLPSDRMPSSFPSPSFYLGPTPHHTRRPNLLDVAHRWTERARRQRIAAQGPLATSQHTFTASQPRLLSQHSPTSARHTALRYLPLGRRLHPSPPPRHAPPPTLGYATKPSTTLHRREAFSKLA